MGYLCLVTCLALSSERGTMHCIRVEKKIGQILEEDQLWGDRRTELVVIGQDMDHAAMMEALQACVVTDEEMAFYTSTYRNDVPFFTPSDKKMPGNQDDLEERIRRYNIEILAPKKKKTQPW